MKKVLVAALCMGALAACGGSGEVPAAGDPDTEEFDLDPAQQMEIDDAADSGESAGGTYTYNEETGILRFDVETSSFSCIEEELVAEVTELTQTTMVWEFDDGGGVNWTRVDSGTMGIVGVWKTDDPALFLVVQNSGDFQLFGEGPCGDEDRPRNGDGCVEMGLTGIDPVLDGNVSEWDGVNQDGRITDAANDYSGSDDGADLAGMRVEYFGNSLFVLMELHTGPSTNFQSREEPYGGAYRITVRGDNGLSLSDRIFYNEGQSQWQTTDAPEITAAVGDTGIEFAIDLSNYEGEGFENIDLIMVEPLDCSSGSCEFLDPMDCGYIQVPN